MISEYKQEISMILGKLHDRGFTFTHEGTTLSLDEAIDEVVAYDEILLETKNGAGKYKNILFVAGNGAGYAICNHHCDDDIDEVSTEVNDYFEARDAEVNPEAAYINKVAYSAEAVKAGIKELTEINEKLEPMARAKINDALEAKDFDMAREQLEEFYHNFKDADEDVILHGYEVLLMDIESLEENALATV